MRTGKRIAFIDLEDTVMEPVLMGWAATQQIALAIKVSAFLKEWKPDEVRVFSFAVNTTADAEAFREHVQAGLERVLGFRISQVPTTDNEIIPGFAKSCGYTRRR